MYLVCRLLSLPCSTLFPYTTLFRSPFAGPALDQPPRQARAGEPAAEAGGQRLADLLQPRMHELVDREELVALHAHLGADAFEAGGAGLEVGDADRVFVRHPQREVARGLVDELDVAPAGHRADAREAV